MRYKWVLDSYKFRDRLVPNVSQVLSVSDRMGGWKVRWGIKRMHYTIPPGLYSTGSPNESSPVFVTANYKLSFDRLRSSLHNIDGWILVLDTKGVNVWCAAGKGTFGTCELIRQIEQTALSDIVDHRKLIVPQLGATGVSAHEVKSKSGFRVLFGPVRAIDTAAFLANNSRTTDAMRKVNFTLWDRLILAPVEVVSSLKYSIIVAAMMLILSGFYSEGFALERVTDAGLNSVIMIIGALVTGAVLVPALLPIIPGKPFAIKGAIVGLLTIIPLVILFPELFMGTLGKIAWLCLFPTITSYLGMNFTGSSTYTSLSGVLKEMKYAVPTQIMVGVIGMGIWITGLFI